MGHRLWTGVVRAILQFSNFVSGEVVVLAPVIISAIGLALVVLHQERKKPAAP